MSKVIYQPDNKCVLESVADGEAVAGLFVGIYMNTYSRKYTALFDCLMSASAPVQHNMTALCLDWFAALAKDTYYDDRNRASVELSRDISADGNALASKKGKVTEEDNQAKTIGYKDDIQIADMLALYLISNNGDNKAFINSALFGHKTLQQNFSRFCMGWFQAVTEANPTSKKEYVKAAKKAFAHNRYLPMV